MHRPAGKTQTQRQKFLEGRGAGRENLFQKGFPPRKLFFLHISRRLPAIPKTKNPRRSGDNQNHPQSGWFALAL